MDSAKTAAFFARPAETTARNHARRGIIGDMIFDMTVSTLVRFVGEVEPISFSDTKTTRNGLNNGYRGYYSRCVVHPTST